MRSRASVRTSSRISSCSSVSGSQGIGRILGRSLVADPLDVVPVGVEDVRGVVVRVVLERGFLARRCRFRLRRAPPRGTASTVLAIGAGERRRARRRSGRGVPIPKSSPAVVGEVRERARPPRKRPEYPSVPRSLRRTPSPGPSSPTFTATWSTISLPSLGTVAAHDPRERRHPHDGSVAADDSRARDRRRARGGRRRDARAGVARARMSSISAAAASFPASPTRTSTSRPGRSRSAR